MGYVQEDEKQEKSCGGNNSCHIVYILKCDDCCCGGTGYGDAYLNEFIPDKTLVHRDLVIRPRFRRNVTIKLDAGDGRLIFEENKEFKSYSQDKYEVEISRWATKDSDKYNDYQPTGWKNNTTDEIYAIGQTVKLDYSTTLTAIYKATPKTYTVNVTTPYGVLLNGKTTDTFSGGYDEYLTFV